MRTFFENRENTILVFFKNYSCSLNVMFYMFFVFFRTKKTGNQTSSPYFPYSPCFWEYKTIFKNRNQIGLELFCSNPFTSNFWDAMMLCIGETRNFSFIIEKIFIVGLIIFAATRKELFEANDLLERLYFTSHALEKSKKLHQSYRLSDVDL